MANKLAIITGASTGIGYELAKLAADEGYDLIIAADEPLIQTSADDFRRGGNKVDAIEADLATFEGNDKLLAAAQGRQIDVLCANAGRGLGRAFVDQDVADWRHVIDTNVTGTTYLLQKAAQQMKRQGSGKILITGSIAGLMPGAFQAVYNGTKAYLDSIAYAMREELKDTGVGITVLMPGATETEFFERGDMMDTKVGTQEKDDAAKVAKDGWEAMKSGTAHVVSGWHNKLQAAMSHITPDSLMAKRHRAMAEPGTAE